MIIIHVQSDQQKTAIKYCNKQYYIIGTVVFM